MMELLRMGNVILFPVLNRNQRGKQIPEFDQPVARCSQGEGFVPSSENIKKHRRRNRRTR